MPSPFHSVAFCTITQILTGTALLHLTLLGLRVFLARRKRNNIPIAENGKRTFLAKKNGICNDMCRPVIQRTWGLGWTDGELDKMIPERSIGIMLERTWETMPKRCDFTSEVMEEARAAFKQGREVAFLPWRPYGTRDVAGF